MANGASPTTTGTQNSTLAQILTQDLSPQYKGFQIPRYTQAGMGALEQLTTSGMQQLPQVGSQLGFQPTADWATQQLQEKTIPALFGAYNMRGGPRAGYGSALPEALGRTARDFGLGLAAKRGDFELAKHEALRKQLELGLRPQYETAIQPVQPEPPSPWESFVSDFSGKAGEIAPDLAVEGIKGLGGWLTGGDVPKESADILQDAAKSGNTWGYLSKLSPTKWGPAALSLIGKLGFGPAMAAMGITGLGALTMYALYRAVGGSGHHHHRRS